MMNLYTDLAAAKDELRRAKDHEQTMRAIAEAVELTGKNADDRKRELAFILSQHAGWRTALADLRDCELAVDRCQAAIDQLEAEQRDREWKIRARLADALHGQREDTAFDRVSDQRLFIRAKIERDLRDPDNRAQAQREMDDLYPTK